MCQTCIFDTTNSQIVVRIRYKFSRAYSRKFLSFPMQKLWHLASEQSTRHDAFVFFCLLVFMSILALLYVHNYSTFLRSFLLLLHASRAERSINIHNTSKTFEQLLVCDKCEYKHVFDCVCIYWFAKHAGILWQSWTAGIFYFTSFVNFYILFI